MEKALGRRVTSALAFLGGKSDQAGPLADSWCRLGAKFRRSARGRVSARASVEGDALNRLSSDCGPRGRALIRGERRGRRRGLDGGSIGSRGMVHRPSRGNRLTSGMQPPSPRHLPTSATGTGWERTPWHATQRAAWEALRTARY